MMTKNGVCYELNKSPFRYKVEGVEYVFSSLLYVNKFKERLHENRESINNSLSKRFGYDVSANFLCDMVLYKKIEKRGFLVIVNGVDLEWEKEIKIDLKRNNKDD